VDSLDDIPEWIQHVEDWPENDEPIWNLTKVREIVSQLNYLKGSYVGHELKIKELEEKFEMALEYQREVDAQLLERLGATIAADMVRKGK
jgi:hypothetical protein